MSGGMVHIPWYATGFRGDQLQEELIRISALATRYGATGYAVHRNRDDRYKLLQMLEFDDHADLPENQSASVVKHSLVDQKVRSLKALTAVRARINSKISEKAILR